MKGLSKIMDKFVAGLTTHHITRWNGFQHDHYREMISQKRLVILDMVELELELGEDEVLRLVAEIDWYGSVHASQFGLLEYLTKKKAEVDNE